MNFRGITFLTAMMTIALVACSREKPQAMPQTETAEPGWPAEVQDVEITSSVDGTSQPAKFYAPENQSGPVPLLVHLHTWSGDWTQQDMGFGWLEGARARGWAYIHPNFRGANGKPESTGSELATADILDAVAWVRARLDVDSSRIYLAGTSGGGHMSLLTSARSPQLWAAVSAWVPIFDLAQWHAECVQRGLDYARQMENACGGVPGAGAAVDSQYALRSSKSVLQNAAGLKYDINTGIHDGHSGSVPVGHALRAFGMLAAANGRADKELSEEEIGRFERDEAVPAELAGERVDDARYGEKVVRFRRKAGPVRVTVFEGGHEDVPEAGCEWLSRQVKE